MNKTKMGRPVLPEVAKVKRVSLQVSLSPEHKEAYRTRMGRDAFIDLLELPEDKWHRVIDILMESE